MKQIHSGAWRTFLLVLILITPVFLPGCADDDDDSEPATVVVDDDDDNNDDSQTPDDQAVSYAADIKPILDGSCIGCHSSELADGARSGAPTAVNFDTYAGAVESAERALVRITAGTMPPGGALSEAEQALFSAWVEQDTPQ